MDRHTPTMLAVDNPTGPTVVLSEQARRQIQAVAATSPVKSIMGFLAGTPPEKAAEGGYEVRVAHAFEADHLLHSFIPPLWTAATLRDAKRKARQPAGCMACVVLGWVASRPGWGIHLTDEDLAFHRGFFRAAWAIFILIDPILRKAGIFSWTDDGERIVKLDYEWQWQ